LNSAGKTDVKNMKVDISDLEQYEKIYIDALKALKTESTFIVSKIHVQFYIIRL
jgi:ATP-dependent RNA helicase DDX51/DBP6